MSIYHVSSIIQYDLFSLFFLQRLKYVGAKYCMCGILQHKHSRSCRFTEFTLSSSITSNSNKACVYVVFQTREDYLGLLHDCLSRNLNTCVAFPSLSATQLTDIAVKLEYSVFTANRVVTMYRRGMAFLVSHRILAVALHGESSDVEWLKTMNIPGLQQIQRESARILVISPTYGTIWDLASFPGVGPEDLISNHVCWLEWPREGLLVFSTPNSWG